MTKPPGALSAAERERYARQIRLPRFGEEAQARLKGAHVLIVGCGALGTLAAERLVRAGVGRLRLVDRDIVEWSNLPRQTLFSEDDAALARPKALAAERALSAINSACTLEAVACHVEAVNMEALLEGVDVAVDGCDNFATRYLMNDACVKHAIPWVYAGVLATEGVTLPVLPGDGPCLRCLFEEPPPPEAVETCDSAGVLGTAVSFVSALQVTEVIKILTGNREAVSRRLLRFDLWDGRFQGMDVSQARREDCPACGLARYDFLMSRRESQVTSLCGRNAYQILPPPGTSRDLRALAERLPESQILARSPLYLRLFADGATLTLFTDGRAIVAEARDGDHARSLYSRLVGD